MTSILRLVFMVFLSVFAVTNVSLAEENPAPLAPPTPQTAPAPQAAVDTVEGLAGAFLDHFPRAEGQVTASEGDKVTFNIGSKDGLKPGMEVLLFRPGKAIRHPVTKVILGTRETPLGKAVVTEARDKESDGKVAELLVTKIIPGDIGRLPTDRAKLLIAVYGKDYNELVLSRLMTKLRDSGRFDITGPVEIPAASALDAASAKKLIADNGAGGLVALKTAPTKKQERTSVDMTLYSTDGGTLEARSGVVDITSEVYGETVNNYPLVLGEHRDFYHIENLPYRGMHMCAGNISGDGKTEFAVSDGHGLIVYRFDDAGIHELWRTEGSVSDTVLDLECADLNGNGRDEIYVTSMTEGKPYSYVVEYDDGGFKRVADGLPVFLRVLDVPKAGKKLITSTLGSDAPYSGVIREYRWDGGALKKGDALDLPRKIKDPYGFVLVDLFPDKPAKKDAKGAGKKAAVKSRFDGLEIVWVDDSDFIQVLDMKGERLWKSKDRSGGYDTFFERGEKELAMENVDTRGKVKGKLIVMDGPDGEPVVVVTRNIPMTYLTRRFKGFSGAEIHALAWNGTELEDRWSIMNIEGYLADIYMGDVLNNGRQSVMILTAPTFKAEKSSKKLAIGGVKGVTDSFADKSALLIYKTPQR